MARLGIALAGLGMAAAGAAVMLGLLKVLFPDISLHPPFLHMQPLGAGERWVLLAWAPMFALNILGEEAFGRGYLLPRNELAMGKAGWLVNGCGWLLFHVAFGFVILVLAAPLIFATCWAAQKSRNTVVPIFIHAVVNGPTFLAMSLGLLPS